MQQWESRVPILAGPPQACCAQTMSTTYGYFTSWWFWLFCPTVLVLFLILLLKLCLDFPRLLCRCVEEPEPQKFTPRQAEEEYYKEEEEEEEEEEQIVVVGYRSIG